MILVVKANNLQ
ncbi:UNVERIFIED_CONTAM: hypothetical protein GTU68_052999 [Idotea baltica]|nr:hypothetical protein [Idotea baltica]